jgi:hypothetical protein
MSEPMFIRTNDTLRSESSYWLGSDRCANHRIIRKTYPEAVMSSRITSLKSDKMTVKRLTSTTINCCADRAIPARLFERGRCYTKHCIDKKKYPRPGGCLVWRRRKSHDRHGGMLTFFPNPLFLSTERTPNWRRYKPASDGSSPGLPTDKLARTRLKPVNEHGNAPQ